MEGTTSALVNTDTITIPEKKVDGQTRSNTSNNDMKMVSVANIDTFSSKNSKSQHSDVTMTPQKKKSNNSGNKVYQTPSPKRLIQSNYSTIEDQFENGDDSDGYGGPYVSETDQTYNKDLLPERAAPSVITLENGTVTIVGTTI